MRSQIMWLLLVPLLAVSCADIGEGTPGQMGVLPMPVTMVVIGDFGVGSDAQYQVAEAIRDRVANTAVDVLVTTGDNFYTDDLDLIWEGPYGWLDDEDIDVAAAWGNHDIESAKRRQNVELTLGPPGNWYSADMGNGKLIVLDSNRVDDPEQTRWLIDELDEAAAPVVVAFHHPSFSCGYHGSDPSVQERWVPILSEHPVVLVLNGHDHDYQRFVVDRQTYVVTGGGGQRIRPAGECPDGTPDPRVANHSDNHFVILEVAPSSLSVEVVAVDGEILDEFEIDY